MKLAKFSIKFLLIICLLNLSNCGLIKKPDFSKKALEPDGKKRARKNVEEGRGLIFGGKNKQGGDFLFASSNPLWRASLDTINFMSLSSVDYAGGLIITDWYSGEESDGSESIKITITFLSNEIRADGIDVDIRKKKCDQYNKCKIKKIKSDLNNQIKKKILKKAAIYQKDLKAQRKKNRVEKKYPGSNE
jgi:hypothetical protein